MRHLMTLAAGAALMLASSSVCFASDGSEGAGGGGGGGETTAAPSPAATITGGDGNDVVAAKPKAAQSKAEKAPKAAKSADGRVHIVWAAPGHPSFAPGQMLTAKAETAEGLRARGNARLASDAEVKAATDAKADVPAFD